jgi:hypothetical protein
MTKSVKTSTESVKEPRGTDYESMDDEDSVIEVGEMMPGLRVAPDVVARVRTAIFVGNLLPLQLLHPNRL